MRYHHIAPDLFDAIAHGGGGREALDALLRSQYSKHMLLLHGVIAETNADHPDATFVRHGQALLARVDHLHGDVVSTVIKHPSVGAWAHRTLAGLRGEPVVPGAVPGMVSAIAAAAAVRASVQGEIAVPVVGGLVTLPSLGVAGPFGGEVAVVRFNARSVEVSCADEVVTIPSDYWKQVTGWRPLTLLLDETWPSDAPTESSEPRFVLLADDADPLRMPSAPHAMRESDVQTWAEVFHAAWMLLVTHYPGVAAEVAALVRVIVPLAPPAEGQDSSSSPETFGAMAMSRPADPVRLAVTLTHEVQHVKLSALLDVVQMTRPDRGARFYAPWREDPRPASGLLQGIYAYLGVTLFWRKRLTSEAAFCDLESAEIEFARWRKAAACGAATLLSSDELTPSGREFVRGITATLADCEQVQVSEESSARAARENDRHWQRWEEANDGRCSDLR